MIYYEVHNYTDEYDEYVNDDTNINASNINDIWTTRNFSKKPPITFIPLRFDKKEDAIRVRNILQKETLRLYNTHIMYYLSKTPKPNWNVYEFNK